MEGCSAIHPSTLLPKTQQYDMEFAKGSDVVVMHDTLQNGPTSKVQQQHLKLP